MMSFSQKLVAVHCFSVHKIWRFRSTWHGPYFKSKGVGIIVLVSVHLGDFVYVSSSCVNSFISLWLFGIFDRDVISTLYPSCRLRVPWNTFKSRSYLRETLFCTSLNRHGRWLVFNKKRQFWWFKNVFSVLC